MYSMTLCCRRGRRSRTPQQLPYAHHLNLVHHLFEAGFSAPTEHKNAPGEATDKCQFFFFCGCLGRLRRHTSLLGALRCSACSATLRLLLPLAPRLASQLAPGPAAARAPRTSPSLPRRSRLMHYGGGGSASPTRDGRGAGRRVCGYAAQDVAVRGQENGYCRGFVATSTPRRFPVGDHHCAARSVDRGLLRRRGNVGADAPVKSTRRRHARGRTRTPAPGGGGHDGIAQQPAAR